MMFRGVCKSLDRLQTRHETQVQYTQLPYSSCLCMSTACQDRISDRSEYKLSFRLRLPKYLNFVMLASRGYSWGDVVIPESDMRGHVNVTYTLLLELK